MSKTDMVAGIPIWHSAFYIYESFLKPATESNPDPFHHAKFCATTGIVYRLEGRSEDNWVRGVMRRKKDKWIWV